MNVLQLTPELNAGGVERTTLEVAEGLIAAGHTAHVVSAGGRMENELINMGAHLHPYDIGSKNILTYGARVRALKKIIKAHKIDIVHARSRATYHGIYNAKSSLKRRYNAVMTKGALTIANSNMTKEHIINEHGLEESRIIVIPRGVDMAAFDPAKIKASDIDRVRESWGIKTSEAAVLLPGRLTRWKGQITAIRAAAKLADNTSIKLIIMGDAQGRDAYVRELKDLITAHKIKHKVHFAPHNANMPLMLAASDIVLSTSIEPEAFGRVAVEAQAMGKPIIASAHGGTLETVLPLKTGLWVKPNNETDLADAINQIIGNDKASFARSYDSVFARAHIAHNFSKRALQEKTLAVYERLLSS